MGFGHRAPDLGSFPSASGFLAFGPLVDAPQSFAFTLRTRTLAFVRTQLSIVGRLLAIVCNSVPLISDAVSLIGDPLAPRNLALTPRESMLARVQICSAMVAPIGRVGTVVGDHDSP